MSKIDKKRVSVTVQYPVWQRLKKLEVEKEIWGKSEAIEFLLNEYERNKSQN